MKGIIMSLSFGLVLVAALLFAWFLFQVLIMPTDEGCENVFDKMALSALSIVTVICCSIMGIIFVCGFAVSLLCTWRPRRASPP